MTDLVLARPGAALRAEAHWSKALPMGIGYLASNARSKGISVAIVDGKILGHTSREQTVAQILKVNPTVVGLSALTVEYCDALEIARQVKLKNANIVTALGGAHANASPGETLKNSPEFDCVFAGESETSIVDFMKSIGNNHDTSRIAGLWQHAADGSVRSCGPPRYDHDIASLPFPAWDLFPKQKVYPIIAERGCPFSCVFCSNNMAQKVRSRPIAHIIEELEWLHREFAPEWICFEDETFALHAERTKELLARIIEFNQGQSIKFKAQTRIDRISEPVMRLMKRAGFEYLEIGVESGDQEVLTRSKKGIHAADVAEAVAIVKKAGIKAWVNFIIGLPGETRQSVRSSIDLAVRLNPERLSVAIIVAYPGTEVYQWALENKNGYRLLTSDWSRFDKYLSASVELQNLPYSVMRRLQLQMYSETYLRNLRLGDFVRLIWNNRSFVYPVIQSVIRKSPLATNRG